MKALQEYVQSHTKVLDISEGVPDTDYVDMVLLYITFINNPDRQEFCSIAYREYPQLFDDMEHNYLEIEANIGSLEIALACMGLGYYLKIWTLRTPRNMLPPKAPDDIVLELALSGFITIHTPA
jgi:hypothetical protein